MSFVKGRVDIAVDVTLHWLRGPKLAEIFFRKLKKSGRRYATIAVKQAVNVLYLFGWLLHPVGWPLPLAPVVVVILRPHF